MRRDRLVTAAGLVALAALAWIWLISGAGLGMSAWDMTRVSLFPHRAAGSMDGMAMPMAEPPGWPTKPKGWAACWARSSFKRTDFRTQIQGGYYG